MQIRKLGFDDLECASRVLWESFYHTEKNNHSEKGVEHFHELTSTFSLSVNIADGSVSLFGAFLDDALVGVAALKGQGHILLLYVKPAYFRGGVGSALLSYLEKQIEGEVITVNASDFAIHFYEKKGYKVCGKRSIKEEMITTPMKKYKGAFSIDPLEEAMKVKDYVIACRRHIHENPELSHKEDETVRFILSELEKMGVECFEVPGARVVARISGTSDGKKLLLRADIDALPIQESPGNGTFPKACVSRVDGVSHACGHDAHTAMLLGAASVLSQNRDQILGQITLFFERGEENGNGDVHMKSYIAENGLSFDGAWAIHVNSKFDSGVMAICEGGVYAAGIFFSAELKKGESASATPVQCISAITRQLESARALSVSPFESLTLSVCKIQADGDICRIGGTCRFHDRDSGGILMHDIIRRVIEEIALAYGYVVNTVKVSKPAYPVINNPHCCRIARKALAIAIGDERVREGGRSMGSESFRLFTARYPSVLAALGVANKEKGITSEIHTPHFEVCEDALPYGVAATLAYALTFLRNEEDINFTPTA